MYGDAAMVRIRIIFEKKGLISFLNHQDLPVLFSRAAKRAGLSMEFTQGFSPHPHISLGPPLASGVEGCYEPADFWFNEWGGTSLEVWNAALPEGLKILECAEADGPALAKSAVAAVYRICGLGFELGEKAKTVLQESVGENTLYAASVDCGCIVLAVGDLEHCSAGSLVKILRENGICSGWPDLFIVRESVGSWDAVSGRVLPLI